MRQIMEYHKMPFVILAFSAYVGYNYFNSKSAQADPVESLLNVVAVGASLITIVAFANKLGSK